MPAPPTLELRDVVVSHGRRRVLHALRLDVRPGELLVVVGPSGSGKTTMLRAAAGLEPVDSGRVLIDGDDVTGTPPGDRDLAMVFADLALLPHLDVAANIGFGELARGAGPCCGALRRTSSTSRSPTSTRCCARRPARRCRCCASATGRRWCW